MFSRAPAKRPPRSPVVSAQFESLEDRRLMAVGITIDAGNRQQTMDGFGTSFGGYTPNVLTSSPKFQRMYYQDLGVSMVRVPLQFTALKAPTATSPRPSTWARTSKTTSRNSTSTIPTPCASARWSARA
jgi:O-glycosyl hydrolase